MALNDFFMITSESENIPPLPFHAHTFDDIERICEKSSTSPFMKLIIPFIYWTTNRMDFEDKSRISPEDFNGGYPNSRSTPNREFVDIYYLLKKYASAETLNYSDLVNKYLSTEATSKHITDLITSDMSKLEMSRIMNILFCAIYSAYTMVLYEADERYNDFVKNQTMSQIYNDVSRGSKKQFSIFEIRVFEVMTSLKNIITFRDREHIGPFHNVFFEKTNNAPMLSNIPWQIKHVIETAIVGRSFNDSPSSIYYNTNLKSFMKLLTTYLILMTKAWFGNSILSDYTEKPSAFSAEIASLVNVESHRLLSDEAVASYIICCSLFKRITEYFSEQDALYVTWWPNEQHPRDISVLLTEENAEHLQYVDLSKCFSSILEEYAAVRKKENLLFSGNNLKLYANECYALWKYNTNFSYTCPGHLGLLPEKSIHDFSLASPDACYSDKGLDTIWDACKTLRISKDAQDQYSRFLSNIPYEIGNRIKNYIEIFDTADNNQNNADQICPSFSLQSMEFHSDQTHKQIIVNATTFTYICYLASNKRFNRLTNMEHIISKAIADSCILIMANAKFKEDSILPMQVNTIQFLALYMSSIATGFSIFLNAMIAQDNYLGTAYGAGDSILLNIFNVGVKVQYRCTRLPMFKFQKDPITPPEIISSMDRLDLQAKKDLATIMERANQSTSLSSIEELGRYKNMIKYLARAICENAITAEYVIFMLFTFFNKKTRSLLNLINRFNSIEDIHPFKDLMQEILKTVSNRDSPFHELFDNPTKISYSEIMSTNLSQIEKDLQKIQAKLEPFLEVSVFFTILQEIVISFEFNAFINTTFKTFISASEGASNTTVGDINRYLYSSDSSFPNNNDKLGTVILEDIRSAVTMVESSMQQKYSEGDWEKNNKDNLIPLAKVTVENASEYFKSLLAT
jgi:hypothetical protein